MSELKCTSCGECCRNIAHIPELKVFDRGNGECKHLAYDNTCKIYDERPNVCRVELMYEKYYANKITKVEFINLNISACNYLQEAAGLPIKYRVSTD